MLRNWMLGVALAVAGTNAAQAALAGYGVVVGTPTAHYLEPVQGEGNWPHYVVEVATPAGPYRAVINVFSRVDEQVLHREVPMHPAGDYHGVFALSDGLHTLPYNSAAAASGGALDIMRHPAMLADIAGWPWNQWPPVVNKTTVPVFDNLFAGAQRVYIFGEPYANSDGTKGIHDVHQNQADPAGSSFAALDGQYQDGAMVIEYAPTKVWIPRICGVVPPCFGGYYWYIPNRTLVMTHFRAQLEFSNSSGVGANPTVVNLSGSAAANAWVYYGPYNAGQIQVDLTPTAGSPDLYTQTSGWPSDSSYKLRSANTGGQMEFIRDYASGLVYVAVKANGAASSWTLKVSYLAP